MHPHEIVIRAIDTSPFNLGVEGKDWLASELNVPVTFPNGDVALFENEGDGVFEAHFLLVSRGREAIERTREAFRIMFEKNGAQVIFGLIPVANRKMKMVARWAGAKSRGIRWMPDENGGGETVELFTITRGAI